MPNYSRPNKKEHNDSIFLVFRAFMSVDTFETGTRKYSRPLRAKIAFGVVLPVASTSSMCPSVMKYARRKIIKHMFMQQY